jgi:hypothetical protein
MVRRCKAAITIEGVEATAYRRCPGSMVSLAGNGLARGSEPCSVLPRCHAVGSVTDGGSNVLGNRLQILR